MRESMTNPRQLEYRGDLPRREFRGDRPSLFARIECSRLPNEAAPIPDARGEPGHTKIELVDGGRRQLLPRPIVYHSPTGFEWGYGGSGPHDLAANILAVFLPLKEAWRLHHRFTDEIVSRLEHDEVTLQANAIVDWIQLQWKAEVGS